MQRAAARRHADTQHETSYRCQASPVRRPAAVMRETILDVVAMMMRAVNTCGGQHEMLRFKFEGCWPAAGLGYQRRVRPSVHAVWLVL